MVFRRKARRRSLRLKAGRRSHSSGGENTTQLLLAGGAYGALRGYAANIVAPFTSSFGQYGTPAVLGVAGYLMAKKGTGLIRNVGKAVLTVEAAQLVNGFMGGQSAAGTTTVSQGWQ